MNSFEDLEVYKKARVFRKTISELTKTFPAEEKYRLTDQIIRSSRSVTAQIAEGHGRFHYQENIQFCRISRGSLDETHEHLNTAFDESYITQQHYGALISQKTEVLKLLNAYINYPKKIEGQSLTRNFTQLLTNHQSTII